METFSELLALCAGNSPVPGEFPAQRPVARIFDAFWDLCLNKRLSKQWWGWWFETPSCPLWRYCNVIKKSQAISGDVLFVNNIVVPSCLWNTLYAHGFVVPFFGLFWWIDITYLFHILHDCFTCTGQSYDCPSARGANMYDKRVKLKWPARSDKAVHTTTKNNNAQTMYIILAKYFKCRQSGRYQQTIVIQIQWFLSTCIQYILSIMHIVHHDDVIKWKHFPRYWPFVRGIHRSPVNSPHKGQWRGALMFTLICTRINDWVNNREAGDLRRYRAHYDVIVMMLCRAAPVCYFYNSGIFG